MIGQSSKYRKSANVETSKLQKSLPISRDSGTLKSVFIKIRVEFAKRHRIQEAKENANEDFYAVVPWNISSRSIVLVA